MRHPTFHLDGRNSHHGFQVQPLVQLAFMEEGADLRSCTQDPYVAVCSARDEATMVLETPSCCVQRLVQLICGLLTVGTIPTWNHFHMVHRHSSMLYCMPKNMLLSCNLTDAAQFFIRNLHAAPSLDAFV